jgi:uncharacterized membrane protein YfcA
MLPFDPTPAAIALVVIAFLVAGTSKGVLGVGIPLIAVPALSGVMHPATTLSVLALPIVLSNLWQAFEGRRLGQTFRRFWPAIPTIVIGGVVGAQFITAIDPKSAQSALGVIVLAYAVSQLIGARVPAPASAGEKFWTACVGFVSGLLGGFAAYFGPPVIMYLLALKVTKEEFVSCAGMLYLIGIIPVFATLVYKGVLGKPELMLSGIGVVLILTAVFFGTWLRGHISQEIFRKALLVILIVMALNMLRRGLF